MATTFYDLFPCDENLTSEFPLRLISDGRFQIADRWQPAGEARRLIARHGDYALRLAAARGITSDLLLERFFDCVEGRRLTLCPAQEDAVLELFERKTSS